MYKNRCFRIWCGKTLDTSFTREYMDDILAVKVHVLRRLARDRVWGGKHIPLDVLRTRAPEEYRATHKGRRDFEKGCKELIRNGWILIAVKRTGKSSNAHVSLNPRALSDIF